MNSIRTRLALLNVGVLILVLLLLGFVVYFMARNSLIKAVDAALIERANRFVNPPDGPPFQAPGDSLQASDQEPGDRGQTSGPDGGDRGPGFEGPDDGLGPVFTQGGRGNRRPGGPGGPDGPGGMGDPGGPPMNRLRVLNRAGRAIEPGGQMLTEANRIPYDESAFERVAQEGPLLTTAMVNGEERRIYTILMPPNLPGHRPEGYVLQLSEPLEPTYRAVGVLTSALLTMVPLSVLLAMVGGFYLTGRALRPVGDMQRSAERISGDNLSGRLVVFGNDEFAQLGGTINQMLGRLQNAFSRLEKTLEQQKRFTADASHELKTPLTVIKTNTGLALSQDRSASEYKTTLETVDKAATSMGALVTDLLLLARADAGTLLSRNEPFLLDNAIREAIDMVQAAGGPPISFEGSKKVEARGNPEAIRRVFVNLLTNAAQHTSDEGTISVSLALSPGVAEVHVQDSGKGISPEHLPHLTERFYRVDQARSSGAGSGLGLAICEEILASHKGSLRIESEIGKGTLIVVTLPIEKTIAEPRKQRTTAQPAAKREPRAKRAVAPKNA